jgi:uncharacterized membrane protein YadS
MNVRIASVVAVARCMSPEDTMSAVSARVNQMPSVLGYVTRGTDERNSSVDEGQQECCPCFPVLFILSAISA